MELIVRSVSIFISLLVSLGHMAPAEQKIDYTGHQVLRIHPTTEEQLLLLDKLERNPNYHIDFWSEPIANSSIDLHIPPDVIENVTQQITDAGMTYDVFIQDIQELIDHEDDPYTAADIGEFSPFMPLQDDFRSRSRPRRGRRSAAHGARGSTSRAWTRRQQTGRFLDDELDFFWYSPLGRYGRLDEIHTWMRTIPNYQPNIATLIDIGYSFEGRNLRVIKIGSAGTNKPAIWIDAGIHGREWIAPATAVCLIHMLIAMYGVDDSVTRLVNAYDWYILPVANPDGYEYSHTTDRMWRKTRSFTHRTYNTRCRGVDPNRNFGFQWRGHCDSNLFSMCRSTWPCDSTYAGEHPFSEMETIAMANFLLRRRDSLKLYISLHSYAQLWLTPWSHSSQEPVDYANMVRLSNVSIEAIQAVYNTEYRTGTPALIKYSAGGTSFDWAKAVAGIKYSYTLELRDKGVFGFLLPRRYIVPVCEETWQGIKTAALELLDELY